MRNEFIKELKKKVPWATEFRDFWAKQSNYLDYGWIEQRTTKPDYYEGTQSEWTDKEYKKVTRYSAQYLNSFLNREKDKRHPFVVFKKNSKLWLDHFTKNIPIYYTGNEFTDYFVCVDVDVKDKGSKDGAICAAKLLSDLLWDNCYWEHSKNNLGTHIYIKISKFKGRRDWLLGYFSKRISELCHHCDITMVEIKGVEANIVEKDIICPISGDLIRTKCVSPFGLLVNAPLCRNGIDDFNKLKECTAWNQHQLEQRLGKSSSSASSFTNEMINSQSLGSTTTTKQKNINEIDELKRIMMINDKASQRWNITAYARRTYQITEIDPLLIFIKENRLFNSLDWEDKLQQRKNAFVKCLFLVNEKYNPNFKKEDFLDKDIAERCLLLSKTLSLPAPHPTRRCTINHNDLAITLYITYFCSNQPNEDQTLPTNRIESLWKLWKKTFDCHAFNKNIWQMIRNHMCHLGLFTPISMNYKVGKAMKWVLSTNAKDVIDNKCHSFALQCLPASSFASKQLKDGGMVEDLTERLDEMFN